MSEITALDKVKAQMRDNGGLQANTSKSNIRPAQVITRGNAAGTADKLSDKADVVKSPAEETFANSDVESPAAVQKGRDSESPSPIKNEDDEANGHNQIYSMKSS